VTLLPPATGTAHASPRSGADDLVASLTDIVRSARDAGTHGPAVVASFDHVETAIIELQHALAELQLLVVLDRATPAPDPTAAARAVWDSFPAGRVGDPAALVKASPTLSAMTQAAVTVRSADIFTPEQFELARVIGAEISGHPQYAQALAGKHPTFRVTPKAVAGMQRVLAWLDARGILTGSSVEFSFSHQDKPGTTWNTLTGKPGSAPEKARIFRVVAGTLREDYRAFLGGHWLTAYAAWIAADQFERLGTPHEVYTNVAYDLPADLGGGHSDIDVLVRAGDLLLCIEAKSGPVLVTRNGPSAARKTAQSAARLEKVFARMDLDVQRSYQLLYIERSDETRDQIARALSESGETPVGLMTPDSIRVAIQELAHRA